MKTPPIEWEDLYSLGVAPGATMSGGADGYTVDPQPSRLVRNLLRELAARPAPDGNRLAYLRHIRDLLIAITDWTQAADSPLDDGERAEWATYRQALRDLPGVYSGAGPIPWPEAP